MAMTVDAQMALMDLKNRLSEVVDQVERQHDRVVITKHGRPAAVVVSLDDLTSSPWNTEPTSTGDADPRAQPLARSGPPHPAVRGTSGTELRSAGRRGSPGGSGGEVCGVEPQDRVARPAEDPEPVARQSHGSTAVEELEGALPGTQETRCEHLV